MIAMESMLNMTKNILNNNTMILFWEMLKLGWGIEFSMCYNMSMIWLPNSRYLMLMVVDELSVGNSVSYGVLETMTFEKGL